MKTIEALIADEVVENPALGPDNKIYIHADKAIEIANEHAQSLAKEVVDVLEGIEHVNGREYNKAINNAIELIKAKFQL